MTKAWRVEPAKLLSVAGVSDLVAGSSRGHIPLSKAFFDKLAALCGLVFFAPFMLAIAVILRFSERGPVLFAHERIGQNGRPFRCLKFRTMAVDADDRLAELLRTDPAARAEWETSRKLSADPRVTSLGALLRRTSLDELPQFWNVLRGQMSMVGPRPVTAAELHHYQDRIDYYLAVRPGLTGAWQVGGRSTTTYAERVEMDVDYVRNWTFWRDMRIVLRTVAVVLHGKGAH
ncbi:MAG: sugar transferase [Paracoccaceae bacterium]|nr:sugar transferase [Paracoccaceae bacterium]